MEETDKEPQSATDVLASLQEEVKSEGPAASPVATEVSTPVAESAASTPEDAAATPATAAAAENGASADTKSSISNGTIAARAARRTFAPDDDEPLPTVDAVPFLAALKYAFTACAKEDDQPALAFVVVARDHLRQRLVFAARDGRRWHAAYVAAPENLVQSTVALTRECIEGAIKDLAYAARRDSNAKVVFDWTQPLRWFVRYGAPTPLTIPLADFAPGREPEEWELPSIGRDVVHGLGRPAMLDFEATHEAKARTWLGGGALVRRDELDDHGRRHVTLVDSSGEELARAVLVQLGRTDGLPRDPQQAFPGTLSPAASAGWLERTTDAAARPASEAGRKPRAKKPAASESGIAAGPARTIDPAGRWFVETRNSNTGAWEKTFPGEEAEARGYYESHSDDPRPMRLVGPDGSTVVARPGQAGGPAVAVRKPRGAATKTGAKVVPIGRAKGASAKTASAGKASKKPGAKKAAPTKGRKRR